MIEPQIPTEIGWLASGLRPKPFLGELRAVHYAGPPRSIGYITETQTIEAVAITRLEQWNGREWILVHEIQP